jgi:hypothetical protein
MVNFHSAPPVAAGDFSNLADAHMPGKQGISSHQIRRKSVEDALAY